MDDNSIIKFGKHIGEKLGNIPPSYLLHLKEQGIAKGELLDYINDNEDILNKELADDKQRKIQTKTNS